MFVTSSPPQKEKQAVVGKSEKFQCLEDNMERKTRNCPAADWSSLDEKGVWIFDKELVAGSGTELPSQGLKQKGSRAGR